MKDVWKGMILIAAIMFGILWMTGTFDDGVSVPTPGVCEIEQTTVTFSAFNAHLTTAALTTGNFSVREVGRTAWTTVEAGGTFNTEPGLQLEYIFDNAMDEAYATTGIYTVPCRRYDTVEVTAALPISANITGTYWNSLGQVNTAETMSAGDSSTVEFRFSGEFRRNLGNSEVGYNVISCRYNETEIDEISIAGLERTSLPSFVSAATGMKDITYRFPVLSSNTAQPRYVMSIIADDTINPGNSNITCTIYDSNYAIDTLTNNVVGGIEDSDGTNLGLAESTRVASVEIVIS